MTPNGMIPTLTECTMETEHDKLVSGDSSVGADGKIRRSTRERKTALPNDYISYHESSSEVHTPQLSKLIAPKTSKSSSKRNNKTKAANQADVIQAAAGLLLFGAPCVPAEGVACLSDSTALTSFPENATTLMKKEAQQRPRFGSLLEIAELDRKFMSYQPSFEFRGAFGVNAAESNPVSSTVVALADKKKRKNTIVKRITKKARSISESPTQENTNDMPSSLVKQDQHLGKQTISATCQQMIGFMQPNINTALSSKGDLKPQQSSKEAAQEMIPKVPSSTITETNQSLDPNCKPDPIPSSAIVEVLKKLKPQTASAEAAASQVINCQVDPTYMPVDISLQPMEEIHPVQPVQASIVISAQLMQASIPPLAKCPASSPTSERPMITKTKSHPKGESTNHPNQAKSQQIKNKPSIKTTQVKVNPALSKKTINTARLTPEQKLEMDRAYRCASTARHRAKKKEHMAEITTGIDFFRNLMGMPPREDDSNKNKSRAGQKRPNYDPPADKIDKMTDEEISEWKRLERLRRKREKTAQNLKEENEKIMKLTIEYEQLKQMYENSVGAGASGLSCT